MPDRRLHQLEREAQDQASGLGRRRLLASMRPAATRGQLLAGLLCAVLGFALVAQVRQTQTSSVASLRQGELVALLQNVTDTSTRYDAEAAELQSGSDKAAVAEEVARQQLQSYSVLAGTVAATGPGIELEIDDPNGVVSAAMLLDTVQELRGAGAEAIQIGSGRLGGRPDPNAVRVVAETAFVDELDGGGVRVSGQFLTPPYRLIAIGDAASLDRALNIPGGVIENLRSKQAAGRVTERPTVEVTARRRLPPTGPAASTSGSPAAG